MRLRCEARRAPAILFIDEIDAVGRQRAQDWAEETTNATDLEQILGPSSTDSIVIRKVIVLAAQTGRIFGPCAASSRAIRSAQ